MHYIISCIHDLKDSIYELTLGSYINRIFMSLVHIAMKRRDAHGFLFIGLTRTYWFEPDRLQAWGRANNFNSAQLNWCDKFGDSSLTHFLSHFAL